VSGDTGFRATTWRDAGARRRRDGSKTNQIGDDVMNLFLPRVQRRAVLLAALAAASGVHAQANDYPNRPLTLVVPFPAGGPTDASARLFATAMSESLGQTIVIENRGGAAGTVGSAMVARAATDGYTLLWGGTSTLAVAPGLYKNLKYDAKSFVPIGMALRGPLMLAGRPSLDVRSLADVVQLAKKQTLTIGTAGNGSIGHLAVEYLGGPAQVRFTHVPYRGGGPALTDALGGQIDLIFDNASALYPHVKSGKLRAYAVTGAQPYAPGPEVPTAKSVLGGNVEAYSWFGLVAPAGTPAPVVHKLTVALAKAAQSPDVRRELANAGLEPGLPTAKEFADVIDADFKKWSDIIARANVRADD
jgi:tripartite-type tricarboxylate transporter receptor subunit TctC